MDRVDFENEVRAIKSIFDERVNAREGEGGVYHPDEWVERVDARTATDSRAVGVSEASEAEIIPPSEYQQPLKPSNEFDQFDVETIGPAVRQLIATMETDGYADKAICHACEITSGELEAVRGSGVLAEYRGDSMRERVQKERDLDGAWDELEFRSVVSLKHELAQPDMLSVGEKIALAKTANAAKRKRDRDAELEAKRRDGLAMGNVAISQTNVVQLVLPTSMIGHIRNAARRVATMGEDAYLEKERSIAKSIDPENGHVNFAQAGKVLGVDLDDSGVGQRKVSNAEVLAATGSRIDKSGMIAHEAG